MEAGTAGKEEEDKEGKEQGIYNFRRNERIRKEQD